ncbi:MAG: hypothetical protein ABI920_06565 [Casimicrobiaceae bacterium]
MRAGRWPRGTYVFGDCSVDIPILQNGSVIQRLATTLHISHW